MNRPHQYKSAPHDHIGHSVPSHMQQVIYALLPGVAVYYYFLGGGVLWQILLAVSMACLAEALLLMLRKQPIGPNIKDKSAIVTGLLFALTITPYTPWWINCFGMVFAIVIVKQLYGGIGHNLFNPAMAAYALIILCFPAKMLMWPDVTNPDSRGTLVQSLFIISDISSMNIDIISGATPLEYIKTERLAMNTIPELQSNQLFGLFGGYGWEWINITFLLGGLWLLRRGIISWHIPAGVIAGLFTISLLFYLIDNHRYFSPWFALFSGGTCLCAFFVATDPVTSPSSTRGRLIYGVGVGVLCFIIRTWGKYPDGFVFAILTMNIFSPLIDYYSQAPAFGKKK